MDPQRHQWNQKHSRLKHALDSGDHLLAQELFLQVHAMVHTARLSQSGLFSFPDEIWHDLTEASARMIPPSCEHSIAWITWHMARIEDVTMNLLVAGKPQVLHSEGWIKRLNCAAVDTGNMMSVQDVVQLSMEIDIEVLHAYRFSVGEHTRRNVTGLGPAQLNLKVDPIRLSQVQIEGAVVPAADDLLAYWGKRTIAGLLLMPPTRHNFVHLNEAHKVKACMS